MEQQNEERKPSALVRGSDDAAEAGTSAAAGTPRYSTNHCTQCTLLGRRRRRALRL